MDYCEDCKFAKWGITGREFAKCHHPEIGARTFGPSYTHRLSKPDYTYYYCRSVRTGPDCHGFTQRPIGLLERIGRVVLGHFDRMDIE